MTITANEILSEQRRMEKARQPYESLQDWCIRLAYPGRQSIANHYMSVDQKGRLVGKDIYDATAYNGLEQRNNGIMAFFMPENFKWFTPTLSHRSGQISKRVRAFLQNVGEQLRYDIGRSNYYEMKRLKNLDADSIGAAYMFIDEDVRSGKVMCTLPHPHELYRVQDYWGLTSRLHYSFKKTLREVENEFGKEALTASQRMMLKDGPDTEIKIIHAIYRNEDFDANRPPIGSNRRWLAHWVNVDATKGDQLGKIIRQGGYNTMNPAEWQLNKPTHELYGRGSISQILIEIMTCNYLMRDCMIASATSARPPLIALDTLKDSWNPRPAGVTWLSRQAIGGNLDVRQAVAQVLQTSNYQFGIDMLERFQTIIEARLGVPFFLMLNQMDHTVKTAYEIQQRQAERAALMSPFLASLSAQTDMELDRFFEIGLRAGRMPEIPEELLEMAGVSIDIEYSGPILQLLKQFYERSSLYSVVGDMAQLAQIDQQTLMNVDWDVIAQKMMISNDIPEEALRPIEDVRQQKLLLAQAAEQQATAEQVRQIAPVLGPMTKKIDEGSMLDNIRKAAA
jgi:hypothetical protein